MNMNFLRIYPTNELVYFFYNNRCLYTKNGKLNSNFQSKTSNFEKIDELFFFIDEVFAPSKEIYNAILYFA